MSSALDDSDDEFDQLAPPDNELDKVATDTCSAHTHTHTHMCTNLCGL